MTQATDNQSYCQNMVRNDDPDRYLTVLFAAEDKRRALFALYAFNQEIAKTRETVSETMIGEIRLQWWAEAIEQILDGHVREHPVVQELSEIAQLRTIAPLLMDVIEARKSDLYTDGIADMDALKNYAENVGGKLCQAALLICNDGQPDGREVAVKCGTAWALMGLIRAIPFQASSDDQLISFGVNSNLQQFDDQVREIVQNIATEIENGLKNTKLKSNEAKDQSVLLLISMTRKYLSALKRSDYKVSMFVDNQPGTARKIIGMIWQAIVG
ncbi:squalene/phytoene synthase family protein [Kordiimonas sp. SCSIO 12610]|uniref:phytoene/squalene synthase family protein n=1 Tax=Kordiimonas sp. SCSIO 12610 TaxID=2829597 RepID=UPI0021089230|nr:squalene/phytoene synthase family protein [Kordiimonas sp. SCSIO 12610]UTW53923.1 squalene/phytoene synthase family protein [Kordiimonas sp. SCSIO 12610]